MELIKKQILWTRGPSKMGCTTRIAKTQRVTMAGIHTECVRTKARRTRRKREERRAGRRRAKKKARHNLLVKSLQEPQSRNSSNFQIIHEMQQHGNEIECAAMRWRKR